MTRPGRSGFLAAFAFAAAATGCASIPETHYYALEWDDRPPSSPSPETGSGNGLEVGVDTFVVAPPYDQDRIVYRVGSGNAEVAFYSYHRWAAPLSRTLPGLFAEGLRGAPGIASIEPLNLDRAYTAVLTGKILALEEVDTHEGSTARVRLVLTLRLADGTIVWSADLVGEATSRTDTVAAVVEQMRTALGDVIADARNGLSSALTK